MQKLRKYLIISLIIISLSFILFNSKKEYLSEDNVLGVYINNELNDKFPSKDNAMFQKAVCDDENTKVTWDNNKWGLLISNLNKKVKCNLYFYSGETVFDFDYTGSEQTFIAPVSGTYKLETWGAEGNSTGQWQTNSPASPPGKGGFSSGKISLNFNEKLFISVGNGGEEPNRTKPYNGGGQGSANGGGATSIQNAMIGDGQLKNYSNNLDNIIIVSGGGGGTEWGSYGFPGNGGGFAGTSGHCDDDILSATGGTQTTGGKAGVTKFKNNYDISASPGKFGIGGNSYDTTYGIYQPGGAGGGGFYGGAGTAAGGVGAGGSGYIGNPLLKDKVMYCYNCEESSEESTKTISTTCSEETPTSNCAKKGNGYARITLVSIDE